MLEPTMASGSMDAETAVRIGSLRAAYAAEHLALPMSAVHKDRLEFFGLSGRELERAADEAVLHYGMSAYGSDLDNTQGLDEDEFETLRDYFCRGEILYRLTGTDLRRQAKQPPQFAAFAQAYRAAIADRRAGIKAKAEAKPEPAPASIPPYRPSAFDDFYGETF